jgi:uncharacterized protein
MMDIIVKRNTEAGRFEADLGDGTQAVVQYSINDRVIRYTSVFVPPAHRGQGIAGQITRHALDWARGHDYTVIAQCPYVDAYVQRHPEYQAITQGYQEIKS